MVKAVSKTNRPIGPVGKKNAKGTLICGAQLRKRPGRFCQKTAIFANGRCALHGGKTPAGIYSPNTRTGRWSKYLPTALAANYSAVLSDADLLNLSDDISLLDTRISTVLTKLDTGESPLGWSDAKKHMTAYKTAMKDGKIADAQSAVELLDKAINAGGGEDERWAAVGNLLEQRRKLVETERKRRIDMGSMISSERALLLIGAIEGILRERITDSSLLETIGRDIGSLVGQRAIEPPHTIDGVFAGGVQAVPVASQAVR